MKGPALLRAGGGAAASGTTPPPPGGGGAAEKLNIGGGGALSIAIRFDGALHARWAPGVRVETLKKLI